MKREELIKELKACAYCTPVLDHYCEHRNRCARRREELMAEAAKALEQNEKEARDE